MIEWMIHCQTPSHIPFLTAVLINLSLISATFGLQRQSHSMPCQSVSWETETEGVIQSFSTKTLSNKNQENPEFTSTKWAHTNPIQEC